jgi:hypothetical protein
MSDQSYGALSSVLSAVLLLVGLGIYFFACFCCKRICEKAGHEPGILIWIPIVQFIPLLEVAELPLWFIVLMIIPCVGIIAAVYMWWKICEARGKPGPLALLMLVPVANLGLILYLAFAD